MVAASFGGEQPTAGHNRSGVVGLPEHHGEVVPVLSAGHGSQSVRRATSSAARRPSARTATRDTSTPGRSIAHRTAGSFIAPSAPPVPSPTRSAIHCRSSTTRTNARLPADNPTGRSWRPGSSRSSASIAADHRVPSPVPRADQPTRCTPEPHDGEARLMCRGARGTMRPAPDGQRDRPAQQPLGDRPTGVQTGSTYVSNVAR